MGIDFIESMALSVLFNVLKIVVKNPAKKEALKKALLKLRDQINSAYPDDSTASVQTIAAAPPSLAQQITEAAVNVVTDAASAAAHGGVKDGW